MGYFNDPKEQGMRGRKVPDSYLCSKFSNPGTRKAENLSTNRSLIPILFIYFNFYSEMVVFVTQGWELEFMHTGEDNEHSPGFV